MKKIYLLSVCAFLSVQAWSQTKNALLITPKDSFYVVSGTDSLFQAKVEVKNLTSGTLEFTWEISEISKTGVGVWEHSICDPNNCFSPKTKSAKFALDPGASGSMIIDATTTGVGIIKSKLTLSAKGYATQTIKATFNAGVTVGLSDAILNKIAIAPNPVQDNFRLIGFDQKISQLQVVDIMGKIVRTFEASENTNYDISDLQRGTYFLNLLTADGNRLGSKKLIKAN